MEHLTEVGVDDFDFQDVDFPEDIEAPNYGESSGGNCSNDESSDIDRTLYQMKGPGLSPVKKKKTLLPCNWPGCDKSYQKKKQLKIHKEIHVNPKECSHCMKMFSSNFKRIRHEVLHTREKEPKVKVEVKINVNPKECSYCQKIFPSNSKRKRHETIHTGDKPGMCQECGKSFSSKDNLLKHLKIHTGQKKHGCAMCDEAFYEYSDLKRHLRIHTKDKPYACENCEATFSDIGALKRHQLRSHIKL